MKLKKQTLEYILQKSKKIFIGKEKQILKNVKDKNISVKDMINTKILKQIADYRKIQLICKDFEIFGKVSTPNPILTSYITVLSSTVIAIFYELKVQDKKVLKIEPVFTEENMIELSINGKIIIYVKELIRLALKNIKLIVEMNKKNILSK